MTELFRKVRDFVKQSFNDEAQLLHFDRTVYWVQQLKPDADEGFLLAAIGHDIERAFRRARGGQFADYLQRPGTRFTDAALLAHHSEEGANILGEFLAKEGADADLITRVKRLVSKHEAGGDEDQNVLKDADSISFCENNGPIFVKKLDSLGHDKVREKLDWMYHRVSSQQAKDLATPMYEKMIAELEKARNK